MHALCKGISLKLAPNTTYTLRNRYFAAILYCHKPTSTQNTCTRLAKITSRDVYKHAIVTNRSKITQIVSYQTLFE